MRNKGAAGIDRMDCDRLLGYLLEHKDALTESLRAAERVRDSITVFIEGRLKLKVNREKTECAYIGKLKYLGYGFYVSRGKCRLRLHEKSEAKLRRKLKQITSRSNGMGYEQRKTALRNYLQGWTEYFKYADMGSKVRDIDQWL